MQKLFQYIWCCRMKNFPKYPASQTPGHDARASSRWLWSLCAAMWQLLMIPLFRNLSILLWYYFWYRLFLFGSELVLHPLPPTPASVERGFLVAVHAFKQSPSFFVHSVLVFLSPEVQVVFRILFNRFNPILGLVVNLN